jgi:Polyketide cyclase / dehydrase and lipid transport
MSKFHLITDWQFNASREAVWQLLAAPEEWPSWWRAVKSVEPIADGDADGVGAVRRMTWSAMAWQTALPYTLTFDMRTTRVEPMTRIEGEAEGELSGVGRWGIWPDGRHTRVRYEWIVDLEAPRLRFVEPLLRPVFVWSHNTAMGWGFKGLVAKLAAAGAGAQTMRKN